MAELVEAEVCATELNVGLWRATLVEARAVDQALQARLRGMIGWTVTGVVRVGNAILFEFDNPGAGARFILARFGTSGSWRLADAPRARVMLGFYGPFAPVAASLVEGRRRSGASVEVTDSVLDLPYMRYIATTHDVMSNQFDDRWLALVFARAPVRMSVRDCLVRPEFFPGIGPWISNEALFRAGVAPARRAASLAPRETAELARALILVVSSGVVRRGAAIGSWKNPDGTVGRAGEDFCVHGRAGEPCLVCSAVVKRQKAASGPAFWCERCQPMDFIQGRESTTR